MKLVTVVPAYGRDYRSAEAVRKDFAAGKDFVVNDISSPHDGKPCNVRDLYVSGVQAKIRYDKLRKVVILNPQEVVAANVAKGLDI